MPWAADSVSDYRVVGGWDFAENDANPYDDGPVGLPRHPRGRHRRRRRGQRLGRLGRRAGRRPGRPAGVQRRGRGLLSAGSRTPCSGSTRTATRLKTRSRPSTCRSAPIGMPTPCPVGPCSKTSSPNSKPTASSSPLRRATRSRAYNTPGLSYPAASSHVVPVMSVDDSGLLSYFSQRSDRSIAAPGRYIRSTVPDYAGNHNGVTDDWASFSGTSMASPYVAGASVLDPRGDGVRRLHEHHAADDLRPDDRRRPTGSTTRPPTPITTG